MRIICFEIHFNNEITNEVYKDFYTKVEKDVNSLGFEFKNFEKFRNFNITHLRVGIPSVKEENEIENLQLLILNKYNIVKSIKIE